MSNSPAQQFLEDLLNQAPQLTSAQYREYRRQLDDRLARARREERAMRKIVVAAWVLAAAVFAFAFHLANSRFEGSYLAKLPEPLLLGFVTVVLLCPLTALLLLALHLFKYRRRAVQAKAEAQRAAIAELQRQLNELRQQLAPSPTAGDPPAASK